MAAIVPFIGLITAAISGGVAYSTQRQARKAQESAQERAREKERKLQLDAVASSRQQTATGYDYNATNLIGSNLGGSNASAMLGG